MRSLGHVENIAYDGLVLVRAGFAPRKGVVVLDRRKRPVGRVVRVFGPVKEPFAAVRPDGKPGVSLIGSEVFVDEGGRNARQEDRRGGRGHPVPRVQ